MTFPPLVSHNMLTTETFMDTERELEDDVVSLTCGFWILSSFVSRTVISARGIRASVEIQACPLSYIPLQ